MYDPINLLGIKILPVGLEEAFNIIIQHLERKEGKYFCFLNIHLVMEGVKNQKIKEVLNSSSGNFPDGMGVVYALRFLGYKFKGRARGTNVMLKLCKYAAENGLRIFLYGNTESTLTILKNKLLEMFPGINIVGTFSPPFRSLKNEEEEEIVNLINNSRPDIIFVSLGAPKQEIWMSRNRDRINAIMLGVGAAFDYISGNLREPPEWIKNSGLEWFYRMFQQPKKVIRRMLLAPEFFIRVLTQN